MDFWFNIFRCCVILGSSLLLEVVFFDRLSTKNLVWWNLLLIIGSFSGGLIWNQIEGIEKFIHLDLYIFLFTVALNVVLAKVFLSIAWQTAATLSAISSSLYYSVYVAISHLFKQSAIGQIATSNQQIPHLKFFLIAFAIQLILLLISLSVKKQLKNKSLNKMILDYESPKIELVFSVSIVTLAVAIDRLFRIDTYSFYYGMGAIFGAILGTYLFCRNVLLSRSYEENKQSYYKDMKEYSQVVDEINQEILDFKHDYHNILLSLDHYLKSENMTELESYYKTHILPTIKKLEATTFENEKH